MASRLAATLLTASALLAGGCVSSTRADEPAAKGRVPATPSSTSVAPPEPGRPAGPGVGDYVMVVPENVVYLPWKTVAGAFKGASDGVYAGFDQGRMPAIGAVFSPVNAAVGFLTGFFEGMVMSPGVVGPSDDFGRAMAAPTKRTTTVWWYP
jgi:hypothetical protein